MNDEFVTKETVFHVFGDSLVDSKRLFYPTNESEFEDLSMRLYDLKKLGRATVVLVDGAFDVPQPNHEWYLRHCRLLGAKTLLDKEDHETTTVNLLAAVSSDLVKLLVTVDADAKLGLNESGLPDKGNTHRPVYPWRLRAERVAGLTFRSFTGEPKHVVDFVTVEGDPNHVGTFLESSLTLAQHLTQANILDGLVVYGEHKETIVEAIGLGINTLVIENHTDYAVDPITNQAWSSSDFIERAKRSN